MGNRSILERQVVEEQGMEVCRGEQSGMSCAGNKVGEAVAVLSYLCGLFKSWDGRSKSLEHNFYFFPLLSLLLSLCLCV